jgi:threonine dehydratase
MRVWVQLNDVPGALARLLALVAGLGAIVLTITHERHLRHTPLFYTRVMLEVETRGQEHVERIAAQLLGSGYSMDGCDPLSPKPCVSSTGGPIT